MRYFGVGCLIIFGHLVAWLPCRFQYTLGRLLGGMMYYVIPRRRAIAQKNIDLCFPGLAPMNRRKMLRECFENMGIGVIETCIAWFCPDSLFARYQCTIVGMDALQAAIDSDQGYIFLSSHVTCMEMLGRLLARYVPYGVVYQRNRNPVFDRLMLSSRKQFYTACLERRNVRGFVRHLKAGGHLWYAADQDMSLKGSVFAPFFDISTSTLVGASWMVKQSGAPVLFTTGYRERPGAYVIHCQRLDGFPSGDDATDAMDYNRMIEREIRRAPAQYFWMHRRFKTRPPGESCFYNN